MHLSEWQAMVRAACGLELRRAKPQAAKVRHYRELVLVDRPFQGGGVGDRRGRPVRTRAAGGVSWPSRGRPRARDNLAAVLLWHRILQLLPFLPILSILTRTPSPVTFVFIV